MDAIYRCCFIQPEIASATCSFPLVGYPEVLMALETVCNALPDVVPCTVFKKSRQISGRMAPYVANRLPFKVSWGFANMCRSYFLFVYTSADSQMLLTLSRPCLDTLKPYFPDYSICVFDDGRSAYKITVKPELGDKMNEPNKNTCQSHRL